MLAIRSDWDWPGALRDIFRPRGVNLLVAENTNDIVNVLRQRRICTTIIDTDPGEPETGLWTLKIIRMEQPLMPCILLANRATNMMLEKALQLDAFSVIDKAGGYEYFERPVESAVREKIRQPYFFVIKNKAK